MFLIYKVKNFFFWIDIRTFTYTFASINNFITVLFSEFEKRFKSVEAKAKTTGFSMAELGPEKLDKLWNEVKAEENQ